MMRRMFATLARLRPRVVTLLLLASIAAVIALVNMPGEYGQRQLVPGPKLPANYWQQAYAGNPPRLVRQLEFDVREPTAEQSKNGNAINCLSYGWPFAWRQYLLAVGYGVLAVGETYSSARLAVNLAIWLVMLAVPGAVCEWLLRRYWPRWRFSLQTLLAATGIVAALCAWYAPARNRANIQDPIIAAVGARNRRVWIEHWGPKWLVAVGADRLCRRIVGAELNVNGSDEEEEQERVRLLAELKRLPDLRYLCLKADSLTPEIAFALHGLRRLETIIIEVGELPPESAAALAGAFDGMTRLKMMSVDTDGAKLPSECLAAIGAASQLERLWLIDSRIASGALTELGGMTNLKSLRLVGLRGDPNFRPKPASFWRLPALPRLESLDLEGSYFYDEDLRHLAVLPRLKSLGLQNTDVTGAGLAELARLDSLEELTIDFNAESAEGFRSLLKLKRLKSLHTDVFDKESWESQDELRDLLAYLLHKDQIDNCARTLEGLRTDNPDLLVDDADPLDETAESLQPKCETLPEWSTEAAARQAVRDWREKQAAAAASQSAANPPP